jgi:predicted transcriptional regulator of viral defense system
MSTQIAKTIISQLGGNRFVAMTGAKKFSALENGVQFYVPMKTKNKSNIIKITLNGLDLYDVEFNRVYASKFTSISEFNNVYAEDIENLFRDETGLSTRLF